MTVQTDRLLIACTGRVAARQESPGPLEELSQEVDSLEALFKHYQEQGRLSGTRAASYSEKIAALRAFLEEKRERRK